MNIPPEKVFSTVVDSNHLKYVDKYYMSNSPVEKFDDDHSIVNYRYKFPFPLTNRDFVVLEVNKKVDTNYVALARSVNSSACPVNKSFVRGEILVSGYFIKSVPESPTQSKVSFLMQCDPKGMLPTFLVNMDAPNAPLVLHRIRLLIEKGVKTFNPKA
eukprot:TRINITY_DN3264_c0_g1_i7.p1 TRINITY_DN3264_c0_g1~~TRINITY_DN3264_c0_g1_i7.p1  ORF type:complete len:158 (-),score=17.60 TRINITY_DN3264_c0_g1_i7:10-483(-)